MISSFICQSASIESQLRSATELWSRPGSDASAALNGAIGELGAADASLPGRLQSSLVDRNWDSIEALWQIKNEIKGDSD